MLTTLLQFRQNLFGDFLQGIEYTLSLKSDSLDDRLVLSTKLFRESIDRQDVRQIALIKLQDVGNFIKVVTVFLEVGHQILERLDVGVHALFLGVGNEHDAVYATQNQFATGIVENLPGNGVQVYASFEATHRAQVEGQEIEKQCALGFRGQRDHLAFLLFGGLLIDELQVGGFAAKSSAVIHDLAVNFARGKIDKAQDVPRDLSWAVHHTGTPHVKLCIGSAGVIPHGSDPRQVTLVTLGGHPQVSNWEFIYYSAC